MTDSIPQKELNILYAEDDAMDAELLLMTLERYASLLALNLDVIETISQAKEKVDEGTYDGFILDWNLVDGSGIEIAEHIRAQNKSVPIIFLSGVFTSDRRAMAEAFNPSACLEKDYSKEHVVNMNHLLRSMLKET